MWGGKLIAVAAAAAVLGAPAMAQVRIGHLNTFSGAGAIFGKHQKDAIELALQHLGGKIGGLDVEIIYGDDQRKPELARQVVDEFLKRDHVQFVTGMFWSNILAAVHKQIERSDAFGITTNAGWSPIAGKLCNENMFTTSWNNDQPAEAMGKLMQDEGVDDVFLLSVNYQAGRNMLTGFQRYFKRGTKGPILVRLGQRDYAPEIAQIRAADPKAVFYFLPGGMSVAFAKQWAASGLSTKMLYSVFSVDWSTLPALGDSVVGSFNTSFWSPDLPFEQNKRFVHDFKEKYGYTPSMYAAQAYDMPFLVDSAVRAVGGNLDDRDGIRAAMRKADFPSVRGPFEYNVNHVPIQNFYKREVIKGPDGKVTIVNRGVVFANHKDAYYTECDMKW